jgi:hypothetical protein
MSDARLDAERLAMLLEGRLSPGERERFLADLAADPDAAGDLAAAAAALGATANLRTEAPEASTASASAPQDARPSADRPMPFPWRRYTPLLAAASLLVAAAIGTGIWRMTRPPGLDATFDAIASVQPAATLPDDWSVPPWARTRGADPVAELPAISAMLGARMAELELASRQAPERTPELARSASELVRQIPGSGPALARWEAAANAGQDARWLAEGREAVEPLVDGAAYEFGAVLEGIRLALLAGDDAAVRSLAGRLASLAEREELADRPRREAARVASLLGEDASTPRNPDKRLRADDEALRTVL